MKRANHRLSQGSRFYEHVNKCRNGMTLISSNFSPEKVADGSNDSIYHMYACLYHWGSNKTGTSTRVIKGPFSGELGVDELMKRGRLRAGWSQTLSGPPPCLVLERLCGSLWNCKGRSQEGRVTYSSVGLSHHENPACQTQCTFSNTRR